MLRDVPAVTTDGVAITLNLNAGLLVDLPHLAETGAAGIGLFRTELQFMIADRMPSAKDQQSLYGSILDGAGHRPVTFRSLDIGGDKLLPYMPAVEEENPALGWRAVRIALDRPALLRIQARALVRAAAGRELRIMFPMVSTPDEFHRAKALVVGELAYCRSHDFSVPSAVLLGVMVEVPALLFALDEIAGAADFMSVGSNDLMQFLFAADRGNKLVASRFDPLSRPALRALRQVARRSAALNCPVTVCGEMAGRPLEAMALVGLGIRSLSMSPASVGPVKAMVLALEAGPLSAFLDEELDATGPERDLRAALTEHAGSRGVPV